MAVPVASYLHPMILATRSNLVIANSSTGAFADCKIFNVPTIEYTHYSRKVLQYTKNGAIRPVKPCRFMLWAAD